MDRENIIKIKSILEEIIGEKTYEELKEELRNYDEDIADIYIEMYKLYLAIENYGF